MSDFLSGEEVGYRRTPLISSGRLSDLVNTPNVKSKGRSMSTETIKHGYAFSSAARNAAVQKLLKRIFNETSVPTDDCCTDAGDDDYTSKGDNHRNT